MNEEDKKLLGETADAITEKTITINVEIINPTRLQKWRKQTNKTFDIKPASLGTLIKISRLFLGIETASDEKNLMNLWQKLMVMHADQMAMVIAYAIVNKQEDPPKKLISFLLNNLTPADLAKLCKIVLNQMDIMSFLSSIVLIKGANILETSLKNQRS